jgi:predicted transcriptional regulator
MNETDNTLDEKKVAVTIQVDESFRKELKWYALKNDTTVSELIRDAVREKMQRDTQAA